MNKEDGTTLTLEERNQAYIKKLREKFRKTINLEDVFMAGKASYVYEVKPGNKVYQFTVSSTSGDLPPTSVLHVVESVKIDGVIQTEEQTKELLKKLPTEVTTMIEIVYRTISSVVGEKIAEATTDF